MQKKSTVNLLVIFYVSLALAIFTYRWQIQRFGDNEISFYQLPRHENILNGTAGNPWQYRILSEYMAEEGIQFLENLGFAYPDAARNAFKGFRLFQNLLIFMLTAWYYQTLGIKVQAAFVGMAMLAWAMTHSYLDSDLQFNTHSDLIFYLLAAISIVSQKKWLIIPITFFAALNRETSGLIPFMMLAFYPKFSRRDLLIFGVALAVYGLIYGYLRYIRYESQELILPHGQSPGWELFNFNIRRYQTWELLFATLNIIPVLALLSYRSWPPPLKGFFWAIVPVWFTVHAFFSVMAETRLFLVPMVIVFIPGALLPLLADRPPLPPPYSDPETRYLPPATHF
ncbi:MAG: hypothetical protein K8I82_14125 [Anaerolineae bacterium]|nr:hypothetical protein [Anaerolineae bacterium]